MSLTARQQRFVNEYLVDLNATQAAIRAGYSKKTAKSVGSENLTKPDIAAAIAARQAKVAAKLEITQERVAAELAKIGFANMADYMRGGGDGDPYLDFSNLSRDQAAALAEITVEDFKDGRGEDARDVRRIKFKLHDKRAALVDLGKHLGMFKERVEHTGADGTPLIPETPMTPVEISRWLMVGLKLGVPAADEPALLPAGRENEPR
jgi:phage terminase small subunit